MGDVLLKSFSNLARWALVSTLWLITSQPVLAHETQPAIANISLDGQFEAEVRLNAEAILAGVDLAQYTDTNDAPEVDAYDALRALSAEDITAQLEAAWPTIAPKLTIDGAGAPVLAGVVVEPQDNVELARDTLVTVTAPLADGDGDVVFGWASELGPLVVRLGVDGSDYAAFLDPGELSEPLPRAGIDETAGETFVRYIIEGFEHIIPKGVDHILFVLGLFFFALAWGPLLWQVTAFTLAHTVTLALATLGVVTIPDEWMWLVEAIIALSITYVAIENIFRPKLGWWRTAVVFAFGLLHGLGFASVLGDLGLAQGQFVLSLIAFNIGVEIGQLTVIAFAFVILMIGVWAARQAKLDDVEAMAADEEVMFRAVSIIGSLLIALVGAYWFVERALL